MWDWLTEETRDDKRALIKKYRKLRANQVPRNLIEKDKEYTLVYVMDSGVAESMRKVCSKYLGKKVKNGDIIKIPVTVNCIYEWSIDLASMSNLFEHMLFKKYTYGRSWRLFYRL